MTEIRCVKCRRLLFKAEEEYKSWFYDSAEIQIKCPKCGYKDGFLRVHTFDEILTRMEAQGKVKLSKDYPRRVNIIL